MKASRLTAIGLVAAAGLWIASGHFLPRETAGADVKPVKTVDGRRAAMIALSGARLPASALLGEEGGSSALHDELMDIGAAAACAEGLGVMRASLAMTVEYLKTREQFGVKIGTFQALQHRAVDMFVRTELARGTPDEAADRLIDLVLARGAPDNVTLIIVKAD